MSEEFKLQNDRPSPKRLGAHNITGRQLRFLSGNGECLPGQLDLFEHDGLPERPEADENALDKHA